MTKRVASAIVLLIFTVSIVGRTIERTEAWADQHVHHSQQWAKGPAGNTIGAAHKPATRQTQTTKISEDGSVLDVAFVRSSNVPPSADAFSHGLTGFAEDANRRTPS